MTRAAILSILGLGVGFVVGLAWGQATRSALTGHVTTEAKGGKLIVTVDAGGAAREGLAAALQGRF